jgi:hypothetical protein
MCYGLDDFIFTISRGCDINHVTALYTVADIISQSVPMLQLKYHARHVSSCGLREKVSEKFGTSVVTLDMQFDFMVYLMKNKFESIWKEAVVT